MSWIRQFARVWDAANVRSLPGAPGRHRGPSRSPTGTSATTHRTRRERKGRPVPSGARSPASISPCRSRAFRCSCSFVQFVGRAPTGRGARSAIGSAEVSCARSRRGAVPLAPNPVEFVLVLRQHPALGDAAGTEAVEAVRSPFERLSPADRSARRYDDAVFVIRQHVVYLDLEGLVGELSPPTHVLHHLVDPPVVARDRAPTRDVPHNLLAEESR